MIRLGIIGARGFAGGELLRLALQHPDLRVTYLTSESQAGAPAADAYPTLAGRFELTLKSYDPQEALESADAFILSRPDGEAMRLAPGLVEAGRPVVDVSGDFRVRDPARYERWFGRVHASPSLLESAVYGLPELHPEVRQARLVANPGCYAAAALLALAPLAASGAVLLDGVVIDGKSGVSGAGGRAGLQEEYSFPAVHENVRAYGLVHHRHTAEIEQELERSRPGATVRATFTPHLMPMTRGLYVTCYAPLREEVADVQSVYRDFYRASPFVRVLPGPPETRWTVGSNACLVHAVADPRTGHAICTAALDNLVKGAAGQAIQNLNLMLGLPEVSGLQAAALWP